MESLNRWAMILRMRVTGTTSSPAAGIRGAGATDAGAAGQADPLARGLPTPMPAAAAPGCAASTSRLTTRPFGPVPWTVARSTPRISASLRASGDERTRPLAVMDAAPAARGRRRSRGGRGGDAGRGRGGAWAGFGRAAGRGRRLLRQKAEMSSPGFPITAIVSPTLAWPPSGQEDLQERAFQRGLVVHGGLVRLHLAEHVAALDRVPFLLAPPGQGTGLHGGGQGEHQDFLRHTTPALRRPRSWRRMAARRAPGSGCTACGTSSELTSSTGASSSSKQLRETSHATWEPTLANGHASSITTQRLVLETES